MELSVKRRFRFTQDRHRSAVRQSEANVPFASGRSRARAQGPAERVVQKMGPIARYRIFVQKSHVDGRRGLSHPDVHQTDVGHRQRARPDQHCHYRWGDGVFISFGDNYVLSPHRH